MAGFMRRATGTLIIPIGVVAIVSALCAINGVSLFGTGDSFLLLTRGVAITSLTAMALAINLNSGRFDFSLGAMATLSAVIGTSTALDLGGGFPMMAFITVVAGLGLGAFSGLVYVLLRISPLVSSLGVTLLYEGIAFTISGGANISFVLRNDLTAFAKSPINMILVVGVALGVVYVLFDRSRFGFDYRALITGQNAAVAAGAKERGNAIATYAASGGLMSVVGLILASQVGFIEAGNLNFATIGIMFTAFLPMFVGGWIGRYSNDKLGYLLGAFSTTVIALGYSAMNLTSSVQSVTTALLLVAFLIFLSNEQRIARWWRTLTGRARGGSTPSSLVTTGASAS
ncbi:ABC transporter permease [Microbacterium hominis]|uniref:Sugar ABC transporter permease n=1 Tax=Microbacterium hominis TaxID=162426 RepID=A0A7D4PP48_9MICO|nr:sugar ABC transporter permease [Microbacterium hominis]QKJ20795.1 sugar ABC transporter permease [Microbacterium hominis]